MTKNQSGKLFIKLLESKNNSLHPHYEKRTVTFFKKFFAKKTPHTKNELWRAIGLLTYFEIYAAPKKRSIAFGGSRINKVKRTFLKSLVGYLKERGELEQVIENLHERDENRKSA